MKGRIVSIILFLVGVLNVTPGIVFFSPSSSVRLYGFELSEENFSIVIRHRAVLLALLGAALIYAAFRKAFVVPAIIAALTGKLAFLSLIWASPGHSPELGQVAMFDVGAIIALIVAGLLHLSSRSGASAN